MAKVIKIIDSGRESKLLAKLKKVTGWNASQIIREAIKVFAEVKGVQ